MRRSDSGTGAKKCLNSESARMWWQHLVRSPLPSWAALFWIAPRVLEPSERWWAAMMALKPQSPSPPKSRTRSTCPLKLTAGGSARSLLGTASLAAVSAAAFWEDSASGADGPPSSAPVSYTHLRAHETSAHL
eukprot:7093174-Alexandrium_andersonii.AAC.1